MSRSLTHSRSRSVVGQACGFVRHPLGYCNASNRRSTTPVLRKSWPPEPGRTPVTALDRALDPPNDACRDCADITRRLQQDHVYNEARRQRPSTGVWSGAVADGNEDVVDPAKAERVFVVHGRNSKASRSMFAFLRSLGLKPFEWDQAVALTGEGSPYLGRILDVAFEHAQAVVVLMTPDDVVHLHPDHASGDADPEVRPGGQARPNVLFEAGMAMGRTERRTILVELGEVRTPTDIQGRHVIRLNNSAEMRSALARRLVNADCAVDQSGSDWLREGDFTPPSIGGDLPVGRRLPSSARPTASVDGRWSAGVGNRLDQVQITNTGAVELFEIEVKPPTDISEIQIIQESPIKRLPSGKTATLRGYGPWHHMGGGDVTQFDVHIVARLEDGTPFEQDVFMDAG